MLCAVETQHGTFLKNTANKKNKKKTAQLTDTQSSWMFEQIAAGVVVGLLTFMLQDIDSLLAALPEPL